MACQVKVEDGVLQGKETITSDGFKYYSFEGIPFAQPPIGKLRFRAPLPPLKWTGVMDATKPGNRCVQLKPSDSGQFPGSEDCLYLNVYTPVLPADKLQSLPVIFYIYGGGLVVGYSHYYRPDYFIRHDVIVVTCNYRLHSLGFLCLDIPEVPGNAGLKDCVMGLQWVSRNITNFNGDKFNVTVFGESAGGAMATSLLTSKMADGLFHKIVCESGASIADLYMRTDDAIGKARHIASILGRDIDDKRELYEYLRDLPISELVFATTVAEVSRPGAVNAYLLPVVEKEFENVERFFDEYPLKCLMEGRVKSVPMICGYNSHEGGFVISMNEQNNIKFVKDFRNVIPQCLFIDKNSPRASQFADSLKDLYFKGEEVSEDTKENYLNLMSDIYFKNDVRYFLELYSKFSENLYAYKFSYSGNLNLPIMKSIGVKGASHGDIIQYQFYRETKAKKCSDDDRKVIDFLSETWCNFMKTGKPTYKNQQTEWLPYDQKHRRTIVIDSEIKMAENLELNTLKFWKQTFSGGRHKL